MTRYFIIKDGTIEASTATRDAAIELIKMYKEEEDKKGYWLKSNFYIIKGTEDFNI